MDNLKTSYLGLPLRNPLVASSGPFMDNPEHLVQLEEAGIAAVVLRSIFEEQISAETAGMYQDLAGETSAFAQEYLRADLPGQIGPESYLRKIENARKCVSIPVIASCNCLSKEKWISYARKIEQAGASALELNLYHMPIDPNESSASVEARNLDIIRAVCSEVKIPVSVKLSYHYTALLPYVRHLDACGVRGMTLFSRFLQTDVNVDTESIYYKPNYSTSNVLHTQLRWTAVIRDWVKADLAISGGIHSGDDLIKALLVGANVGCVYSVLQLHPQLHTTIQSILSRLQNWMKAKNYADLNAFRGKLREQNLADGNGFERAQYVKTATNI